jgi:hypothetical protein
VALIRKFAALFDKRSNPATFTANAGPWHAVGSNGLVHAQVGHAGTP